MLVDPDGGGCNDAPGALLNLLRTAKKGELKLQVRAAPDLINISDASLFPSPIGVNPMETIMALSTRNAERLLETSAWRMAA